VPPADRQTSTDTLNRVQNNYNPTQASQILMQDDCAGGQAPSFEQKQLPFEISSSQETLLASLRPELTDTSDYVKVRIRQTLPAYLIAWFRTNGNKPINLQHLVERIQPYQGCMRKMTGERYTSDFTKAVSSSLYHKKVFLKDCMSLWRLSEAKGTDYERELFAIWKDRFPPSKYS
jgi:hypothetical protein